MSEQAVCPSCGKPERQHVSIEMIDHGNGAEPTETGYQPCVEQIMDTVAMHAIDSAMSVTQEKK